MMYIIYIYSYINLRWRCKLKIRLYGVDQLYKEKQTDNAKTITRDDEINVMYRDEFKILLNIDKFLNT
jgi:hypothetical protein